MDIRNTAEFDFFMQRALASFEGGANTDDCYIELYNILLRSFIAADVDYDGRIGLAEFDAMIEAAASLPRKYGYSWWGEASYSDSAGRLAAHEQLFKDIDADGDGAVAFEEWLSYALARYLEQGKELPKAIDCQDKEGFIADCRGAADAGSEAHRKVYWFNVKAFQAADADRDGLVDVTEFGKMMDVATAAQKRLGLPCPFSSPEERQEAFTMMDGNGDGSVSFDEWLNFAMEEIINKVAS